MSKSEEFEKYVLENPYRYIGWLNDEVSIKFFEMIKENIDDYTKMLKYAEIANHLKIAQLQASVQLLEILEQKIEKLFKQITEPNREEVEDEYDDEQERGHIRNP